MQVSSAAGSSEPGCPQGKLPGCPVSGASPDSAAKQGCPYGHGASEPSVPSEASASSSKSSCPVRHGSAFPASRGSAALPDESPVKYQPARKSFFSFFSSSSSSSSTSCPYGMDETDEAAGSSKGAQIEVPVGLSDARERSTIPSVTGENWNYPSEKQFYRVTRLKGHTVSPDDMPAIVAIHNAVNEQTWVEILRYEAFHQRECDKPKLARFVGQPDSLTLKARMKHFLGYERPFDRHDWLIDRCGTQVRYLIDFYDGRATPEDEASGKVAIYIDARPDLLSKHGLLDRAKMFLVKKGLWQQ
ncbi:putative cytochrome c1 heme lyase [Besnoitia besnoiti]|uniref:Holocytochrome c-type synthase n=1 Tax=Besnoitia besnoiti TaxID=94643 RepID=A0A2A9MFF6_BESBE|nr:putative cytochrome c1 heme lyase [Besnoitia besnoiti]PFH34347.1 putative cytochrome c1 heme lyase [Besnoitia besnoiti]